MEFAGSFETHVTVDAVGLRQLEALRTWADQNEVKCLLIELSRGRSILQPMLTWRDTGTLTTQLSKARDVRSRLANAGFHVTRLKLECDPNNEDVPANDAEALREATTRYFEHHVKLRLTNEAELSRLTQIAERHQAHLSRNAVHQREEGLTERFVTQRCRGVGKETADDQLARLKASLVDAGYRIVDVEAEFVVYDSNESLDAGWLPEGAATHENVLAAVKAATP